MSDESRLRELLAGSVPEPPRVPERADRAREYAAAARHRRSGVVALGSLAVAAAVVVPFVLTASDERARPTPGPSPGTTSTPAVVAGDFECPAPWVVEEPAPPNPALDGPTELPPGAVAARLCNGRGGELGFQEPVDALTVGVDKLISSVNALPVQEPCEVIPTDLGTTLGIAFQYRDGSIQVVQVERHGCGGVMVGGQMRGDRETALRPIDRFRELLLAQRRGSTPPQPTIALGCRAETSPIASPKPPLELTRAVLCWQHLTESELPRMSAPIPADDLAILLDDLNTNTTHIEITEEECREQSVALTIVAQNAWGDRIALDGYCGPFNLTQDNGNIWRPDARSRAILDRIVTAQPLVLPDPDASTPPDQVVSLWADMINAGEPERADGLWSQDPPHPSGQVELKTEEVRRVEPPDFMSAPTKLREVTALYRVVPDDGSWVDYHEVVFTLARLDDSRPWRIVSVVDRGAVQTGR